MPWRNSVLWVCHTANLLTSNRVAQPKKMAQWKTTVEKLLNRNKEAVAVARKRVDDTRSEVAKYLTKVMTSQQQQHNRPQRLWLALTHSVASYVRDFAQQFSDRLKAAEAAVTDMQTAQQQLQTVQQHTQQAQAQQAQQAAAMGMMGGAYSRIGTSHGMPPPSSHGMAPPGIMGNMNHRRRHFVVHRSGRHS